MKKKHILLVEDEEDIASLIKLQAELSGYHLSVATDGVTGLDMARRERPDLVLLDVMLPQKNGYDVCRELKGDPKTTHIPIIILSVKSEEVDIILGLELGANDYMPKPFSPLVLFSKVKSTLRNVENLQIHHHQLSFGEFLIDFDAHTMHRGKNEIILTPAEFSLLRRLISNRGRVMTRNQILDDVQREGAFVIDRNVDVHIASLRRKLGPRFDWIETVRGVGYRFREPIRDT